ncbi:reverse transcriptase (RNA-dependent DNA polymerase) domain-containing protein [Phthorimaea operculella]|nr:reverse transcriptase (RNA-dependent DNA polymerase) domain-containing protein [Phthorimaea operculella]
MIRNNFPKEHRSKGTKLTPIYCLCLVGCLSILGPILFVTYCADIVSCIENCSHHLYADALQLYISAKPQNTSAAVKLLNEDLDRITDWSNANSLVLNPDKSKYIVSGSKKQIKDIKSYSPYVTISGVQIERVDEARNLGLNFDGSLTFEKHVAQTYTSLQNNLVSISAKHKWVPQNTSAVIPTMYYITAHC